MASFKITLAYDGTDFCGWQAQAAGRTVQQTVEQAWEQVTGERLRLVASGRTDAGVHATGQIASLESASQLPPETLCRALNANLPADVRILDVSPAWPGFHAIRDTRSKRYRYLIQPGSQANPFHRRYAWLVSHPLDTERMRAAAVKLSGTHDFASFQGSGSVRRTTERTISDFTVDVIPSPWEIGSSGRLICIEVEADGFLYNMVRILVNTLHDVGSGKRELAWVDDVLRARDRRVASATAPAHGLCLREVKLREP